MPYLVKYFDGIQNKQVNLECKELWEFIDVVNKLIENPDMNLLWVYCKNIEEDE